MGSGCRGRRPAGGRYAVLTALRMGEKSLLVGMTNRQRPSLRDSHTAPTARFSSASAASYRYFPLYSTATTRPSFSRQRKIRVEPIRRGLQPERGGLARQIANPELHFRQLVEELRAFELFGEGAAGRDLAQFAGLRSEVVFLELKTAFVAPTGFVAQGLEVNDLLLAGPRAAHRAGGTVETRLSARFRGAAGCGLQSRRAVDTDPAPARSHLGWRTLPSGRE